MRHKKVLRESKSTPYELRGTLMFSKPQIRTNVKQRCLSVQGVKLWNSLDDELKTCKSIGSFKKLYIKKDYIIQSRMNLAASFSHSLCTQDDFGVWCFGVVCKIN